MKNLCGKTRDVNNPYEVWMSRDGRWTWRVLKKWQIDDNKEYARWFCAVKSPYTHGSYDMGDVYVSEIKALAVKLEPLATVGMEEW
jgi:hypothetical protein